MFQQSNEECKIEVKKSKTGVTTKFSGRCSKEQIEYAKNQEGGDKVDS